MSRRPDPTSFRSAASRFLTGVTVVGSIDRDGSLAGMTANSFTTVSTRPPTVLVSLMRGRTWQAVTDSGIYTVNVVRAQDVATCALFAGKSPREGAMPLVELDGFPVLPQAIARFACEVVRSIHIADHTLFIGEVRWCWHQDGSPLAFYASQFRNGLGAELQAAESIT